MVNTARKAPFLPPEVIDMVRSPEIITPFLLMARSDLFSKILDNLAPASSCLLQSQKMQMPHEQIQVLRKLRLVNHGFNGAALPRLFHTVRLLSSVCLIKPMMSSREWVQRCVTKFRDLSTSGLATFVISVHIVLPSELLATEHCHSLESVLVLCLPRFVNLEQFSFIWMQYTGFRAYGPVADTSGLENAEDWKESPVTYPSVEIPSEGQVGGVDRRPRSALGRKRACGCGERGQSTPLAAACR